MKKLMFTMALALSFTVLAQEAPRRPRMGGEMMGDPAAMAVMNPKIAEKAGIPEDLRAQIKKLDADGKAQLHELQEKMRAAMEKQAKLMKEPKVDEAAVMSAIDELFEVRKAMAKAQTKRVISIKSLLTPEQIQKVSEAMKDFRGARGERGVRGERGPKGDRGPKPEGDKPCPNAACDKPKA